MIKFEWDAGKASANQKKHAVSFEEAKSVFYDEYAIQFYDHDKTDKEDRFLMLGMSNQTRLLLVCHCVRGRNDTIRIISSRLATKKESKLYLGGAP